MQLGAMIYSFAPAIRSGEMTQRQAIELCAELDLACVDTMAGLGGDPWPEVRRMVEDAGLFVACHIAFAPLSSGGPAERRQAFDTVRTAIADTVAVGADKLMVVTGHIPEGDSREAVQKRIGKALGELGLEARDAGVRLCIEDFPGITSPHQTSAHLLRLCEIAGPDLGVCFDTGNFYSGGETPQEAWPALAEKTIHAHLKDWIWDDDGRLCTPDGRRFRPELVGRGIIDYPTVLGQMKTSGYEGALSFEYEGGLDRRAAVREGIAYLRRLLDCL
ncbi:MAG: sugar phosphate isomerase/epimerase [Kiritimatiellaeota bacterium]|nr:sugar phosphate isomerase/epimerase [Kiritimatiellota bacterium]